MALEVAVTQGESWWLTKTGEGGRGLPNCGGGLAVDVDSSATGGRPTVIWCEEGVVGDRRAARSEIREEAEPGDRNWEIGERERGSAAGDD